MIDVQKAVAEYPEAAVRRQESTTRKHFFDTNVLNRSSVQMRLSIYNWNPGPRRGEEGAFEKQIARKCHIFSLQEAIDYVDHELLTNRFHVTHHGGCAVLFNKDTFPDVRSSPFTSTIPGANCPIRWRKVVRAGFYKECFHVPPFVDLLSAAQITFTVLSVHINNIYAKKHGKKLILTVRALMLDEHVDLVAGEFNGAAWRCSSRNNISTIDGAFADCALPSPPGLPTLVVTWIASKRLGWRLWVPQTSRIRSVLESSTPRCLFHSSWSTRPAPDRSMLPPRNMASPRLRRMARRSATTWKITVEITASRKGASVISWATTRSLRDIATIRARPSNTMWNAYILTKWFDGASIPIWWSRMLRFLLPRSFRCWPPTSHACPPWPSRHGVPTKKLSMMCFFERVLVALTSSWPPQSTWSAICTEPNSGSSGVKTAIADATGGAGRWTVLFEARLCSLFLAHIETMSGLPWIYAVPIPMFVTFTPVGWMFQ